MPPNVTMLSEYEDKRQEVPYKRVDNAYDSGISPESVTKLSQILNSQRPNSVEIDGQDTGISMIREKVGETHAKHGEDLQGRLSDDEFVDNKGLKWEASEDGSSVDAHVIHNGSTTKIKSFSTENFDGVSNDLGENERERGAEDLSLKNHSYDIKEQNKYRKLLGSS